MRFNPKSEKEIQEDRFPVLKPGKYHFEVADAKDDVSKKSGNPMIVLKLKIMDNGFNVLTYVTDYLMESMAYKLRHAAYGCGLGTHYDSGELHPDMFMGRTGTLDLSIQKDKAGQYPDKNSVHDYIKDEQEQTAAAGASKDQWDDVPEPPHWVK